MIKKICKIKNVGKFVDCNPSGDVEFRRLTLIYAENGRGKTTLASIIRSLREGNGDHVIGRQTLGQKEAPLIEIRVDGEFVTFKNGKWDKSFPNIDIFDTTFIHDNIHSGDFVDHEHKKTLYKTVIGDKAVKLAETVAKLDKIIRLTHSAINELETQITPHIKDGLSLSDFVKLQQTENLKTKTAAKESEVYALTKAKAIAEKKILGEITLPNLPTGLDALLAKQLPDLTKEVEAGVKAQIRQLADPEAESWLGKGVSYATGKRCPFCNSDTNANELVVSYSAYFSKAYRELKESIRAAQGKLDAWFNEKTLLQVQKILGSNEGLVDFWKEFVPLATNTLDSGDVQVVVNELKSALGEVLARKQAAPLDAIEPSEAVIVARDEFRLLAEKTESYNKYVTQANEAITVKKVATSTGNLQTVKDELVKLRNIPVRLAPELKDLCGKYLQHEKNLVEEGKAKEQAKQALDDETMAVFGKYSASTNRHLSDFGAGFHIGELCPSYIGGSPSSSYSILINNVSVELGDDTTPTKVPSFRNTMSSGDKSTLAFAFFLAKLDNDSGLADRVVVLDDPISSQDRFRSSYTQGQICRLMNSTKEVVVLSHDAYFLRGLWDRVSKKAEVRTLAVVRDCVTDSTIKAWDIEQDTAGEYFQNYFALAGFLENGAKGVNLLYVVRCIRPLLEGNLRLRFPGKFRTGWLGDFIREIRDSNDEELAALKPMLPKLTDINEYSKRYYHGTNPEAQLEPINERELSTFVRQTLKVLSGVWTSLG